MQIQLENVKEYLRIEHNDEDMILQSILDCAIAQCETMLNRPLLEENMTDETRWKVPKNVEMAIYLLCSNWYENRSPLLTGDKQNTKELPYGLSAILSPYTYRQV